jgi:hypothetical protein
MIILLLTIVLIYEQLHPLSLVVSGCGEFLSRRDELVFFFCWLTIAAIAPAMVCGQNFVLHFIARLTAPAPPPRPLSSFRILYHHFIEIY